MLCSESLQMDVRTGPATAPRGGECRQAAKGRDQGSNGEPVGVPADSSSPSLSRWSVQTPGLPDNSAPGALLSQRREGANLARYRAPLGHRSARTSSLWLTPRQTREPLQPGRPPFRLTDRPGTAAPVRCPQTHGQARRPGFPPRGSTAAPAARLTATRCRPAPRKPLRGTES